MSKYAHLRCWVIFVALLIFPQSVKAAVLQDQNRVLVAYNLNTDHCTQLAVNPALPAKQAADWACSEAFLALDRLDGNSCKKCGYPECRQLALPHFDYYQCSCKVTSCTEYEFRNEVFPFRDCAWKVYAEELLAGGVTPLPTVNFQKTRQQIYDRAVQKAKHRRDKSSSLQEGPEGYPVKAPETKPKTFVCPDCHRQYKSRETLRDHYKSHLLNLRCKFCDLPYSTVGNYNQHMRNTHQEKLETNPELIASTSGNAVILEEKIKKPNICDGCGRTFKWAKSLQAHRKVHEEEARCNFCKRNFSTRSNLTHHINVYHSDPPKAETEDESSKPKEKENPFPCDLCEASFKAKKSLQIHMQVHRGETYCDLCEQTFSRKAALRLHRKRRHP